MKKNYGNNYLYPGDFERRNKRVGCRPASSPLTVLPPTRPITMENPAMTGEKPASASSDWVARYPGDILRQGPVPRKLAALTFDDGPDGLFTPLLLDVLAQYAVKATFFSRGSCIRQHAAIVKRMAQEGHILANHAYSHQNLTELSPDQVVQEIKATEDVIHEVTGLRPALFRPPFGAMGETVIQISLSLGYKIILWNIDTLDWTGITGPEITARVVPVLSPGAIILMHNQCEVNVPAGSGSLQSVSYIIAILRALGYQLVTIPELLNIPAYQ